MKNSIIFTFLFLSIPSFLYAQQVVDIDLKTQLTTELLNRDLMSTEEAQVLIYRELKYECSIPLSFGIYSYTFTTSHAVPGLFILQDKEISILTDYDYQEVFQKFNTLFVNKNMEYEDRLYYFSEIFKVLYLRLNSGDDVIPDSLIDLDAVYEFDKDSTQH